MSTDFDKFFAGEFQRRLEATSVPGMADASWDRKAAWLLFHAEQRSGPTLQPSHTPEPKPAAGSIFD